MISAGWGISMAVHTIPQFWLVAGRSASAAQGIVLETTHFDGAAGVVQIVLVSLVAVLALLLLVYHMQEMTPRDRWIPMAGGTVGAPVTWFVAAGAAACAVGLSIRCPVLIVTRGKAHHHIAEIQGLRGRFVGMLMILVAYAACQVVCLRIVIATGWGELVTAGTSPDLLFLVTSGHALACDRVILKAADLDDTG